MTKRDVVFKFWLIIAGIVFALLLVEFALRISGGLLLTTREIRNRKSLSAEGTYKILCLGESTTQNQWPRFLEEELNRRYPEITFKVIDKGRAGTFTGTILFRLEEYIDTYRPQMVVAMMGINDGEWVWKNPVEYEDKTSVKLRLFLKNTRLNKLARYIADGLRTNKAGNEPINIAPPRPSNDVGASVGPRNPQDYAALGNYFRETGDYEKAERMFEAAINADPKNVWRYIDLGKQHLEKGAYDKAEKAYEAGIKANPKDPWPYLHLGRLYHEKGETEKAAKMYEAGIKIDPANRLAYLDFGKMYRETMDYEKAAIMYSAAAKSDQERKIPYVAIEQRNLVKDEDDKKILMYEAAVEAEPKNSWAYHELAKLYRWKGDRHKLEKLYEKGIRENTGNPWMYLQLGMLYVENGLHEKAEAVIAKAREAIGDTPEMAGALSVYYLQRGEKALEAKTRKLSYLPMESTRNYQNLRDRVMERGIKLVCMQYPMREVATLKNTLGTGRGIIFVENRENFKQALGTMKLNDVFIDMFGGDFGHCTDVGNKLIASNLAGTILREAFGRKEPHGNND